MRRATDTGAAVVEFVLISVLLIMLLFGVVQVGVYFYARNIVAASAADAARYAAAAGVPASAGGPRAEQLIASGLGFRLSRDISCRSGFDVSGADHLPVTTVHCTGHVRALFVGIDVPLRIDTTASALKESSG
jgi:Flp pilus assembly protein TadG